MPKGTRHTEIGTLRSNHFGFVLEMDGGGFWVLEFWSVRRINQYLNQRVTVEGIRTGFNQLEVVRIKRDEESWPLEQIWKVWFNRGRRN
ncbi:DUF5818 domain-containing protein [Sphingobium baderi]|uniref:DUF5818 domain-containing protein n=1 Tax=Sphingobium baderi TaxID=1332080 RepID=UPI002B40C7E3|nr:DUF5818 domain-containing protein [Sphingobium baderi]WRD77816.1 DUF5818 domain-containing protein [Sphingobium baderi]